jgi:hypothetical protein
MILISYSPTTDIKKEERYNQMYYKNSIQIEFKKLQKMLEKDYVYSPFIYKSGKRLKELIISKAYFVILDIDLGDKDIYQQHQELKDEYLIHLIATTSDPNNLTKYRILLPLNKGVTFEEYHNLVKGIQNFNLIENIDDASNKPSQMFYSYKNSIVLHNFEGEKLDVDAYLTEVTQTKSNANNKNLNNCEDFIKNYNNPGPLKGHEALTSASYNMAKAGFNKEEFIDCIQRINKSWFFPMPVDRLKREFIYPFSHKLF